ncbi:polysaccharide deacetylase family protein [Pseudoxanthobacter sp.]|uniref:polysaccharide deacetylase family protein n=1 Tax=Pseudoxanthobacter sp. TaxID=1925742 RepID=UPI002FDF1D32
MTTPTPCDRSTLRDGLQQLLDAAGEEGRTVDFWWRDDDATEPTLALERLLGIARAFAAPLALAVIPAGATRALAERLAESNDVHVLQHGWSHTNHQPAGARAAEVGDARPADVVLQELDGGRIRLEALFGPQFLPVLTPPWNRIAPDVAARRGEIGLHGLSTFASRVAEPGRVDCHLDPIAWRAGRGYIGDAKALAIAAEEIDARRDTPVPVGLLTHHLAHDDGVWGFIETAVAVISAHPAARWAPLPALFSAPPA